MILFGAGDDEIQYPEGLHKWMENPAEEDENGDLEPYLDVDYGENEGPDALAAPAPPWGEDSK